jgi:ribosomal protein S18 acetylase RimI-like enzyme
MDAQGSWRVASLSPSRREDYLAFFDHERGRAFADNPAWAGCYCHFFHAATALDWSALPADANRTAIGARIEVGEMEGFLAYADADRIVGWLNAQPRHKLPHCFARLNVPPTPIDVPASEAAVVLCFVIDPALRRRGVARALLTHALASFAARGIRVVDAFPATVADQNAAAHFRGPLSLYEQLGFSRIAVHGDTIAVRKTLQ